LSPPGFGSNVDSCPTGAFVFEFPTHEFSTRDKGAAIRIRLILHPATHQDLGECLRHALAQAGNPKLITDELVVTLAEHAAGNYRILMTMARGLLDAAIQSGTRQLAEKLYLETFAVPSTPERGRLRSNGARAPVPQNA
jgi:hypothetical protein